MFNPAFLGLLLILFFVGRIFGKLTKNIRLWKILVLGYFALFLYAPVRDAGPILGGIFIAGMLSNHVGTFFSVLSWAGNLEDVLFAFKYRSAYEDIRRREQELEERERRLREAELRQAYQQQGQGQRARAGWQQEAKGFRQQNDSQKTQQGPGRQKQNDNRSQRSYHSSDTRGKGAGSTKPAEDKKARCLKILGLDPRRSYNPDELKAAYRKKVKKTHPDAGGSQAKFIEVVSAFEWLSHQ
ncbi:DnaJ domain-containing protein [Donghicola sp. C2-DW-16]|uniref:DnaJ domain-containing protein n=1 Tax=Donghicola mangrovi TaxID=2729614 RepID=A0ABX2PD21_9RHOB|nr:DnaJ domain-containing protein [Donghicola mangrovi]NVO26732.1 DnaJ domain-containing protein [Donghicola mangrovi]